jgi:hypothetical protein
MVSVVMLSYTVINLTRLIEGRNPLIANSELTGMFQSPDQGLSLENIKVAFYVEDIRTNEPKDDESMVRMYGFIE